MKITDDIIKKMIIMITEITIITILKIRMIVMIITVIGILTRPKDKIQQNIETVVSVFTKSSLY